MPRAELLADLAGFPDRLSAVARAAATRPTPDGEWTPELVVRHLIAVEIEVHQARLEDLSTLEDPRWSWVEPAPWTDEPALDLDALLGRFAGVRSATLATVAALDDDGWARTGTHERLGVWDVEGLLHNAVEHDREHVGGLIVP